MSCADCARYAEDFAAAFREAGWQVRRPAALGMSQASPKGVALLFREYSDAVTGKKTICSPLY
jgi:hypothetical protein